MILCDSTHQTAHGGSCKKEEKFFWKQNSFATKKTPADL